MLPDEPELPERSDDPDDPDEPDGLDEPDEPDDPDEPDEALRPDCPLLLEPDIPPEFSPLPDDSAFRCRSRSRSCDEPDDDPELPPPPVLEPLDEACRSRSDVDCPSPCDELPRSRCELPDEALLSLWPLFDEPEVFRSRSAM